ncbi:MAG: DUF523 domain-containing protein [Calditrichia bacterium]
MKKILISACLLGEKVRYDGGGCLQNSDFLNRLSAEAELVPVCPEVAGGLSVPRQPAEIQTGNGSGVLQSGAEIINAAGENVTRNFIKGAQRTCEVAEEHRIKVAVLKANSPSCGNQQIYDGTFSGRLIAGEGVTAALLRQAGISVFNENEIEPALAAITEPDTE